MVKIAVHRPVHAIDQRDRGPNGNRPTTKGWQAEVPKACSVRIGHYQAQSVSNFTHIDNETKVTPAQLVEV